MAPLDSPYHLLASLPRSLWLPGLISHTGQAPSQPDTSDTQGDGKFSDTTAARLAHLQIWQQALAEGQLPDSDADFGDAEALAPLRQAAAGLGLAALCRGAAEPTEQLLRTLLWHLDRLIDLQPAQTRPQAIAQVTQDFTTAWTILKGDWDAALALLHGLGDPGALRWDELRGQLSRREWAEAQRISEALRSMPELASLVRRLGRNERATHPPQALPPSASERPQPRQLGLSAIETHLPQAPGELQGIRHSDHIERMLGSEAAMLVHPVLHKLWRARRAEARLLTYDTQAVLIDWRPDPRQPPRQAPLPPTPQALERGPIIVCMDTSGSMRGGPETVAKAVVLQALRTALAEHRGCLLLAFGGPDEILERDLAPPRGGPGPGCRPSGLQVLLDVMGQGFDGGTDVQGPIERAIDKVHQARWARADLLIVSDGEFGCTPATLARLDEARSQLGLRVQGVLVGDRETMGLMDVADDIFWVRDWRRHGTLPRTGRPGSPAGKGFSPVHSKSLTALYFPNALSARAARHKPG